AARSVRERDPVADRPGRVRRPLPERSVTARREDRPTRRDRQPLGPDAIRQQLDDPLALVDADAPVLENSPSQDPCDYGPGRRAARMQDAAPRVPALESEALVERDAEAAKVGDPLGRLPRQDGDCVRGTEAATGKPGVL